MASAKPFDSMISNPPETLLACCHINLDEQAKFGSGWLAVTTKALYSGKGPLPADQTTVDELQQVAQHQWPIQKELRLTLTTRPTIGQLELRVSQEVLKCWKFSAGITPEVERLKDCFKTQCEHFSHGEKQTFTRKKNTRGASHKVPKKISTG